MTTDRRLQTGYRQMFSDRIFTDAVTEEHYRQVTDRRSQTERQLDMATYGRLQIVTERLHRL